MLVSGLQWVLALAGGCPPALCGKGKSLGDQQRRALISKTSLTQSSYPRLLARRRINSVYFGTWEDFVSVNP